MNCNVKDKKKVSQNPFKNWKENGCSDDTLSMSFLDFLESCWEKTTSSWKTLNVYPKKVRHRT